MVKGGTEFNISYSCFSFLYAVSRHLGSRPRGRIFKRGWGATFTSKWATLLLAPLCSAFGLTVYSQL